MVIEVVGDDFLSLIYLSLFKGSPTINPVY